VKYTHMCIAYYSLLFLAFYLYGPTDQTDQPIFMLSGSNDAVRANDVPFESGVDARLGVEHLPKPRAT
jgi:hypothetical protein